MLLAAVAIAAHVLHVAGRRVGLFVAGGIPAVIGLAAYQWAAFGNPLSFSYARSSFGEAATAAGDVDQDPALLENAVRVLVGERGLLVVTPILVLATLGAIQLVRAGRPRRSAYVAALASAASLVLVQMAWSNPTGGDSPGARYATATAAFLAPGIALAWGRWPRATRITALLGGLIMLAATWSNPLKAHTTPHRRDRHLVRPHLLRRVGAHGVRDGPGGLGGGVAPPRGGGGRRRGGLGEPTRQRRSRRRRSLPVSAEDLDRPPVAWGSILRWCSVSAAIAVLLIAGSAVPARGHRGAPVRG